MASEMPYKFYSDYHKNLTDDLNHICDDLLKAKWFFLASIAALGTAYMKVHADMPRSIEPWGILIICLIGNIIFWFISEYTLSHAFLFRLIQSRLAKIERIFDTPGNAKDPSEERNYIKGGLLDLDYIIPDQFIPIYWASFWLIIINTVTAFALQKITLMPNINFWDGFNDESFVSWLFSFLLVGIPFIWKLWTYHMYKLNKFFMETCDLHFIVKKDSEELFKTSYKLLLWGLVVGLVLWFLLYICGILHFFISTILLFALLGFFWPVFPGLLIHVLRIFFRFDKKYSWLVPKTEISADRKQRVVQLTNQFSILICQLYKIV